MIQDGRAQEFGLMENPKEMSTDQNPIQPGYYVTWANYFVAPGEETIIWLDIRKTPK